MQPRGDPRWAKLCNDIPEGGGGSSRGNDFISASWRRSRERWARTLRPDRRAGTHDRDWLLRKTAYRKKAVLPVDLPFLPPNSTQHSQSSILLPSPRKLKSRRQIDHGQPSRHPVDRRPIPPPKPHNPQSIPLRPPYCPRRCCGNLHRYHTHHLRPRFPPDLSQ